MDKSFSEGCWDTWIPGLQCCLFPCFQSAHISFKHMREMPQAGLARLIHITWRSWERVVSPNSSGSQMSREASDWPDLAQSQLNKSRRADRWCALIGQAWSWGQPGRSAPSWTTWTWGGLVSQVGVLGELHSCVPDQLGDLLKFIRLLRAIVFSAI